MKRTKKLLSFFLAIMMVITTIPAFILTASADEVSGSLDYTGYRYIAGHDVFHRDSKRIDSSNVSGAVSPTINVCNDGEAGNFCTGLWIYSLSAVPSNTISITTAEITFRIVKYEGDSRGLNFYVTGDTPNNKTNIGNSVSNATGLFTGTGLVPVESYVKNDIGVKTFTIDVTSAMNTAIENRWTYFNIYAIQETAGDKAPKGWSDCHIEKPSISFTATTPTSGASDVDTAAYNTAINSYLSKMNDSNVYYNMQAAYNAYIALKQSYDLFYYGGSTTMTADTVNNNILKLNAAVDKMTPWTSYNSFFVPTKKEQLFAGDNQSGITGGNENYKNFYVNTLYVAGSVEDITSNTGNYLTVKWNMPYAVGLYKDSPIEVPVMSGIYSDIPWNYDNKNGYMFTNFFDASKYSGQTTSNYNGQITYKDHWSYRSGTGSKHFSWATAGRTGYAAGRVYDSPYQNFCSNGNGGTNEIRWAYNTVSINPTGFTNNYQEFTTLNLFSRASNVQSNYSNWQAGQLLYKNGASVGYYIIDYRPVANNLTTAKNKIREGIVNFDSDNLDMANLMGSVDKLTGVNNTIANTFPLTASGVSKTDCQSKATSVANAITSSVSEFTKNNNNTAADSAKTTAYNNLRSAMDSARANYQKGEAELKKTYTKSSVEAFITKYNNAKSIMSKVGTYDDNYGHNASDTNTKANELNNARLVQKADFEYYDARVSDVATALGIITAKDGQYIRVYRLLEPYTKITLYTEEQKADTPITEQTTVNNKGAQIDTLNTNVDNSSVLGSDYVDQTALKAFIDKNFDLDVVDNSNITDQKKSANGLYEKITFNGNEYWSLNVKDQAELDSNIAGYINSINSTLGKYDIKVPEGISVAVSGQPQTPTSTTDGISTYRLTYGVPVTFTSSNADTAWYMSYVSNVAQRGVQYQCSGGTYATKVMGNMTITPKARVNDTTPNKVTVVRQYSDGSSSAMLIDYVNGSYVLPTAQTYPNYVFAGYEVNGTEYNAGATVTITGDTVIYAKYTADGGDHQIIITDTNGTRTDKTYKYNSAVKLNDPNAYAWIEKPIGSDTWRPSYIGTGCSYKVTEPMELKAVATVDEMKQLCGTKEAYAPNLRYNGPLVANGMGVVFHGQFINYVPAGAQIVEYGVAVNTNNANSFDLINTNGKVIRCKSTNPMKSNQFSVGARYNGDTFTSSTTISYRSYMIYQITVNGQLETRYAYSDVRTFNPNPNA